MRQQMNWLTRLPNELEFQTVVLATVYRGDIEDRYLDFVYINEYGQFVNYESEEKLKVKILAWSYLPETYLVK